MGDLQTVVDVPTEQLSVRTEALSWPDKARAVQIVDDASYRSAMEMLKGIKGLRGEVERTFGSIVSKAHAVWKEAIAKRKEADEPLDLAESLIKNKGVAYQTEQECKAREEARRREAEERQRQEALRLEEAAALEREALAADDPAALLEANDLIEQPPPVAVVPVAPATPKVAGISYRTVYGAELVSLRHLVQAAAQDDRLLALLSFNQSAASQQAKAQREHFRVPGVRLTVRKVAAAGRG